MRVQTNSRNDRIEKRARWTHGLAKFSARDVSVPRDVVSCQGMIYRCLHTVALGKTLGCRRGSLLDLAFPIGQTWINVDTLRWSCVSLPLRPRPAHPGCRITKSGREMDVRGKFSTARAAPHLTERDQSLVRRRKCRDCGYPPAHLLANGIFETRPAARRYSFAASDWTDGRAHRRIYLSGGR